MKRNELPLEVNAWTLAGTQGRACESTEQCSYIMVKRVNKNFGLLRHI